jgi:hypothetical protein
MCLVMGAVVAQPGAVGHAGVWSLEPPAMPLPRRVELALGLDLRHLDPRTVAVDRSSGAAARSRGGKDDPDDRPGNVIALFLHSTAEAARGIYLGIDLELGAGAPDGTDPSGRRSAVYWGAGAIVSAVPTRGRLVLRGELIAGVRGLSVPVAGSRWSSHVRAVIEPRLALELTLDDHFSLGVHAGSELMPHRTPVMGVYLRHRGRAASADLLTAP